MDAEVWFQLLRFLPHRNIDATTILASLTFTDVNRRTSPKIRWPRQNIQQRRNADTYTLDGGIAAHYPPRPHIAFGSLDTKGPRRPLKLGSLRTAIHAHRPPTTMDIIENHFPNHGK